MNCVICGTVKNCGKDIQKVYNNMLEIGKLFNEYKIIFCYDHSKDNSLFLLNNFVKSNPNVILHINRDIPFKERTFNLAKARNTYIKIIQERFANYQYMVVMDCDEVSSSPIKLNILQKHLLNSQAGDILSFNKNFYYDSWALSIQPYFINCHLFGSVGSQKSLQYVNQLLKKTHPDHYVRCLSAFNGFAIYKINKVLNCHYNGSIKNISLLPKPLVKKNIRLFNGIKNKMFVDCEHKFFHFMAVLKNKAKCRISPDILFDSAWKG
jgi:hypothetical protein